MDNINNNMDINNEQTGGELLSEGGFGCVFHPMINCQGKETDNTNYVTKVQVKDESAKNEILVSEKIKQIPLYERFFSPITHTCIIRKRKLDDDLVQDCHIFHKVKHKLVLMKMPYAGEYTYFDYILSLQQQEKKIMNVILTTYPYLLHALEKLVKNDVIHFDLKGNNIMFNTKRNIPLIIDFGLSIDFSEFTKERIPFYFYTYSPDYYIWCPEIHMINYLVHESEGKKLTKKSVKHICEEIVNENKIMNSLFSTKERDEYIRDMIDFFSRFIGKKDSTIINKLIEYRNTWDMFSLSLIFFKLIQALQLHNRANNQTNKFIKVFTQLLMKNIHPNPTKRPTIQKAVQSFQNMLMMSQQFDDDYQSILNTMRETRKNRKEYIKTHLRELKNITTQMDVRRKHSRD